MQVLKQTRLNRIRITIEIYIEFKGKRLRRKDIRNLINDLDKPVKPDPSQCCDSGCNPCVYDSYERSLEWYNQQLAELQKLFEKF